MLIDSRTIFWEKTNEAKANRTKLFNLMLICGVNIFVLLSLVFGFRWWEDYPIIACILGFIYFFTLLANEEATKRGGTLFKEGFERLKDWRDYYTSDQFIRTKDDNNSAPIKDGDYLFLWHGNDVEYMRLFTFTEYKKNSYEFYHRKHITKVILKHLINNKDLYVVTQDDEYITSRSLFELQKQLETDEYVIKGVCNTFGDVKWKQSDNPNHPKKLRKYIYDAIEWGWYIVILIAFITPFLPFIMWIRK